MTCGCTPFGPAVPPAPVVPSFAGEVDLGNVSGSPTIEFTNALAVRFALTGNTILTLAGFVPGRTQWFQMKVQQVGAGNWTLQIVGAKKPGGGANYPISTATGSIDILSGYWDGATAWISVAGLAFA